MRRFDGMRRSFLGCKLDKSVSLVFEHSYILNGAKRRKRFLYQLVRDTVRKAATVYGTVGWTTLVIYLLELTMGLISNLNQKNAESRITRQR
jgi:hypothetical protein